MPFSGVDTDRVFKDFVDGSVILVDPVKTVTQEGTAIVVKSNVGRIIGITQSGTATTWIRTVFNSDGTVVTSYMYQY